MGGGVEILTMAIIKSSVFWDVTQCGPLKVNERFKGTCRLRLQAEFVNAVIVWTATINNPL
jgi:hypothetical protein